MQVTCSQDTVGLAAGQSKNKHTTDDPAPKRAALEYSLRYVTDRDSLKAFCEDALALMSSRHAHTEARLTPAHFRLADKLFQISYGVAYGKRGSDPLAPVASDVIERTIASLRRVFDKLPETPAGFVEFPRTNDVIS